MNPKGSVEYIYFFWDLFQSKRVGFVIHIEDGKDMSRGFCFFFGFQSNTLNNSGRDPKTI
jgi:hypothetical protein